MSVDALDNGLKISGDINFETAPGLLKDCKAFLDKWSTINIDLGSVDKVNSASIALFLELVRLAKQKGKTIEFVNTPKTLLRLIQGGNLQGILNAS